MTLLLDRVETTVLKALLQDRPSMEEKVFDVLNEHGMQTLQELSSFLPNPNWAQIVLAVDRLNRAGRISVLCDGTGNYLLFIREERSDMAGDEADTEALASQRWP